jgi:hypothetical protein
MSDFSRRKRRRHPPLGTNWWRIPDARRRFRRTVILFLYYFVYIFMPMLIGFYDLYFSSWLRFHLFVCLWYFYSYFTQTIYWFYALSCLLNPVCIGFLSFMQQIRNLEKGNRSKKWDHLPQFHKSRVCWSISFLTHIIVILNLCTCSRKLIFYAVHHRA